MIVAKKTVSGKEQTRTFSQMSWDLLGKNKEGWVQVSAQPVTGNTQKPDTGEKKIAPSKPVVSTVTSNLTSEDEGKKTGDAPVISDGLNTENKVQFADIKTGDAPAVTVSEEEKAAFMAAVKDVKKGPIKDYFDKQKISYNNAAKEAELQTQLSEVLVYDLKTLKLLF